MALFVSSNLSLGSLSVFQRESWMVQFLDRRCFWYEAKDTTVADRGCPRWVRKESRSLNSTAFPPSCCWSLVKPLMSQNHIFLGRKIWMSTTLYLLLMLFYFLYFQWSNMLGSCWPYSDHTSQGQPVPRVSKGLSWEHVFDMQANPSRMCSPNFFFSQDLTLQATMSWSIHPKAMCQMARKAPMSQMP